MFEIVSHLAVGVVFLVAIAAGDGMAKKADEKEAKRRRSARLRRSVAEMNRADEARKRMMFRKPAAILREDKEPIYEIRGVLADEYKAKIRNPRQVREFKNGMYAMMNREVRG